MDRDSERSIHKTVSFCGKGMKDGEVIKDGTYMEENQNGFDVEATFCNTPRCNFSQKLKCDSFFWLLIFSYFITF